MKHPWVTGSIVTAGLALAGTALWTAAPRVERLPPVEQTPPAGQPTRPSSSPPAAASAQAPRFDGAKAWEHLQQLVAIGPRPAGSPQIRQTRAYITRQLSAMGLTVQEQPFVADTPVGRVDMVNLIVRLPGRQTNRILFTGHYDTKLFKDQTFVGASDGGSSAAFLIELARVLKDQPREFTTEIIWLDGEEAFCTGWTDCGKPDSPDNTYGSRFYVQAAQKAKSLSSVRAMILVDMIGDSDLGIRRDTNSAAWLKDIIWRAAARLAHEKVFLNEDTTVEDDHIPFVQAGVDSVDIIDLDYPYWHTPDDTLARVSQRSLQTVGDVLVAALPDIEARLKR